MTVNHDRSATLIIRVWLEGGPDDFRGRLATVDTSGGHEGGGEIAFAVTSSPGDTVDAVHAWLDAFLQRASAPSDSGS